MVSGSTDMTTMAARERRSDTAVHVVGVSVATLAVPVLVWMTATWRGDSGLTAAVTVYGVCLLSMLTFSAIYNTFNSGPWTPVWRRLDHSAIFLKIAGTYTPLVALSGVAAGPLLAGLWGVALGGTSLKVMAPDRWRRVGLTLYLGMGWVGVWAGSEVLGALNPVALALIAAGGTLYTVGVAFYLWDTLPYHTAIWHVFVLVASALIYTAIAVEVVAGADWAVAGEAVPAQGQGAPPAE